MTPSLLIDCGTALHGRAWQAALAADLQVADRTVRRWAAGSHPIPQGIADELLRLLDQRGTDLASLAQRIRATV